MVRYVVYVQADLEGVTSLSMYKDSDICLSVRNPMNLDEVREKVVLEASNLITPIPPAHERHRTERPYHCSVKWEGATARATARILAVDDALKDEMIESDSGKFVPFVALDCDGLEPFAFHPLGEEFLVVDRAGNRHEKVDLSSGDWSTYDTCIGSSSVMNLKSKIE